MTVLFFLFNHRLTANQSVPLKSVINYRVTRTHPPKDNGVNDTSRKERNKNISCAVSFNALNEMQMPVFLHIKKWLRRKRGWHVGFSLQGTCCSTQWDNCRSTTVPHSTHSRISQQALQASLNKSRSLLGENFTQSSGWGLLFAFPSRVQSH